MSDSGTIKLRSEKEIFFEALDKATPQERAAFLDGACGLNPVQQAWEQHYVTRLRQLLEETRESANRNFEWYYWQRQAHLELKTLRGHLAPVHSAAFSPDGQRIVTGSWDQTAKVWDSASPDQVAAWQAEEHAAGQRLAQRRAAAEASEKPASKQP